jgi:hypothetical protein
VAADEGGNCDGDEEDEDDILPDVWVKRCDPKHNTVTKTGQWWEHQDESLKIRDVFKTAGGDPEELSQKKWCVEIVAKKGDYVIALVNEEGKELGKVLGEYHYLHLKADVRVERSHRWTQTFQSARKRRCALRII